MDSDDGSGPLADLVGAAGTPVTLVFGTFGYRSILERWIEHARAVGCRDYRVVCLDDRLLRYLREDRAETRAVAYRALLPNEPRVDIDALKHHGRRLQALTPRRVTLFRELAENGIDFIHSDADAFWLRDPRPWLEDRGHYDLLVSQGTALPSEHSDRHGFVLCAGFFLCRANERTVRLWSAVEAAVADCPDDQVCLNRALLNDPQGRWRIRSPQPVFAVRTPVGHLLRRFGLTAPVPGWFRLPVRSRTGERIWRGLAGTPLRRRCARLLRRCVLRSIVTSDSVMDGHFAGGLRVGVVPMSVVRRVRIEGDDPRAERRLRVLHLSGNKALVDSSWEKPSSIPAVVRWWHAVAGRKRAP